MTSGIRRREFIAGLGAGLGAGLFASPAIVRAEAAGRHSGRRPELIYSIAPYFYEQFVPAGYKIEVLPFETPTECKNAVVTKSVDFGAFGIAAALLGAAAGEPVVVIASTCNRGMAIIAKKDAGIAAIKELKGKRVAVFPGTTQGGVLPGAAADGRHDDQGCRAGPRFLQRNAYRIVARRHRWRHTVAFSPRNCIVTTGAKRADLPANDHSEIPGENSLEQGVLDHRQHHDLVHSGRACRLRRDRLIDFQMFVDRGHAGSPRAADAAFALCYRL